MFRILFIGNSHTYLHYMPHIFSELAKNRGQEIYTHQCTGEGTSLERHWNRPETKKLIAEGDWSHVVLQERSRGPIEDKSSMFDNARQLNQRIGETGARTVFFMTWASRDQEINQDGMARAYHDIAHECGAMLAPVGKAWEWARSQDDCPELYHRDGRHASKAGAYLNACVFYTLLCGDPMGLSRMVQRDDRVLADLTDYEARLLQAAASKAVSLHGLT